MSQPLSRWILRLLFFFPLCIGIWWGLWEIQVEGFHALFSLWLRAGEPSMAWVSEVQGNEIFYHLTEPGKALTVAVDPLSLTRGIPIYLALMVATPNARALWQSTLWGVLLLLGLAFLGFSLEAALRLNEAVQTGHGTPFLGAAFVQIATKFLVTRILPIGLWLWQQWDLVAQWIGGLRREGSSI